MDEEADVQRVADGGRDGREVPREPRYLHAEEVRRRLPDLVLVPLRLRLELVRPLGRERREPVGRERLLVLSEELGAEQPEQVAPARRLGRRRRREEPAQVEHDVLLLPAEPDLVDLRVQRERRQDAVLRHVVLLEVQLARDGGDLLAHGVVVAHRPPAVVAPEPERLAGHREQRHRDDAVPLVVHKHHVRQEQLVLVEVEEVAHRLQLVRRRLLRVLLRVENPVAVVRELEQDVVDDVL